jgi:hypothetical protein
MPCEPFKVDDAVGIVCTRSRKRTCRWCTRRAHLLCDGASPGRKSGTCDAPICPDHATHVGHNRDLCPDCNATPALIGEVPRG